jgi:hypothetical protein
MINELAIQLNNFPGSASRVWCFAHILNLVVKSIMCQFDVSDKKKGDVADDATQELHRFAGELEHEELLSQSGIEQQDGNVGSMDNVEGWVDEQDEMDADDLMALDNDVQPIRFVLTKVS